jgi:hypothetical protein
VVRGQLCRHRAEVTAACQAVLVRRNAGLARCVRCAKGLMRGVDMFSHIGFVLSCMSASRGHPSRAASHA